MKNIAVAAFVAAALVSTGTSASAISFVPSGTVTFTAADVGQIFAVDFGACVEVNNQCTPTTLDATAAFRIDAYSYDSVTNLTTVDFSVGLRNDTVAPDASRISALGFATNPNIVLSASDATGAFDDVNLGSFPQPQPVIEACVLDEQNNGCNNGVGGPTNGQTILFDLTLAFSGDQSVIQMSEFGVRYQTVTAGGQTGLSGVGEGTPRPPNPNDPPPTPRDVPEPTTLALLGLGLLGAGIARRRK